MKPKKDRIHDWRRLKWPFTISFLYYSLLSFFSGAASGTDGFLSVLITVLILDSAAYIGYCHFLSPKEDDIKKLSFVLFVVYTFMSYDMLKSFVYSLF